MTSGNARLVYKPREQGAESIFYQFGANIKKGWDPVGPASSASPTSSGEAGAAKATKKKATTKKKAEADSARKGVILKITAQSSGTDHDLESFYLAQQDLLVTYHTYGKVRGSVSANTDCVVIGEDPGSK